MKLLVTGAAGFIGSNFCHYALAHSNHEIVAVDSLTYASNLKSLDGLDEKRHSFIKADINDIGELEELVAWSDAVVNFAAATHNDSSLVEPKPFIKSNIEGVYILLELARKHRTRLHQVSTDEVFGELPLNETSRFTEDSKYNPSSPYSASKAAADMLVKAWIRSFEVTATISNCSNNYGPRQHVEKFIPRQITEILLGRKPLVYGSGKQVRDWIHVDDHSEAVLTILERGRVGETYLVGTNGEKTNLEVVQMILSAMGKPDDWLTFVQDRPGHDQRYAIDSSKLQRELGWGTSKVDFRLGLIETINWYSNNWDWWLHTKEATEKWYRKTHRG